MKSLPPESEVALPELALHGKSVTLRRYRAGDLEAFHHAVEESLPRLSLWMPWCHARYSLADSRAWVDSRDAAWAKGEEYSFLITSRDSGRVLGACGLNQFFRIHERCNLGYWVRTGATSQGVATDAAIVLARYGFQSLGLQRIEIVAAIDNLASQRVADKIGAVRECVARNRLRLDSTPRDAVCYSLIPGDLGL